MIQRYIGITPMKFKENLNIGSDATISQNVKNGQNQTNDVRSQNQNIVFLSMRKWSTSRYLYEMYCTSFESLKIVDDT